MSNPRLVLVNGTEAHTAPETVLESVSGVDVLAVATMARRVHAYAQRLAAEAPDMTPERLDRVVSILRSGSTTRSASKAVA